MTQSVRQRKKPPWQALAKGFTLLAFLTVAVYLYQNTAVKDWLTPHMVGRFFETWGTWAPLLYILLLAAGICLFVPASIFIILGSAVFGAFWGFFYGWIGAMAGASGAFFIGRTLGRDCVIHFLGGRLKKYDDAIGKNGFAAVLYLRLINTPFTPMNFGISLTRIRFWDYFFGTGLGIVVALFVLAFFGDLFKDVWTSGNWRSLVSVKSFFAIALYGFSFFIPAILKRVKGGGWGKDKRS